MSTKVISVLSWVAALFAILMALGFSSGRDAMIREVVIYAILSLILIVLGVLNLHGNGKIRNYILATEVLLTGYFILTLGLFFGFIAAIPFILIICVTIYLL